jgi:hypothetical protein
MSTFVKNNLALVSQGITGHKSWNYYDTGSIGDVADVAGYFANAGECGVDTGDFITIRAHNGYTNHLVWGAAFASVQDTGASQGTVGPATVLGDTG